MPGLFYSYPNTYASEKVTKSAARVLIPFAGIFDSYCNRWGLLIRLYNKNSNLWLASSILGNLWCSFELCDDQSPLQNRVYRCKNSNLSAGFGLFPGSKRQPVGVSFELLRRSQKSVSPPGIVAIDRCEARSSCAMTTQAIDQPRFNIEDQLSSIK